MNFDRLSFRFTYEDYMKMLTDDLNNDEKLRELIINDFMKSIENYRRIREDELTRLLQKYTIKLYTKAMYQAGSEMFDNEANHDKMPAYISKFTFDEYTDVAYFYLGELKKDLLGKKSKMLKKKHQKAREFLFMRVYRVINGIMRGINYVSDFSKFFTVHYSINNAIIGDIIMGSIITMAREISAMILYDRSMTRDQKADKERYGMENRYRVENPEFIKPDVSEIRRYAEYENLKRIPYNIESFLFAATNALNLVYSLVDRVGNSKDECFPTAMERKFYGAMANIQTEIKNRIGIDLNIEVVKRDSSKFHLIDKYDPDELKDDIKPKDERESDE